MQNQQQQVIIMSQTQVAELGVSYGRLVDKNQSLTQINKQLEEENRLLKKEIEDKHNKKEIPKVKTTVKESA